MDRVVMLSLTGVTRYPLQYIWPQNTAVVVETTVFFVFKEAPIKR
jgi:hypothetical protein